MFKIYIFFIPTDTAVVNIYLDLSTYLFFSLPNNSTLISYAHFR